MHQVAVGIFQLHKIGIAHQDIKPSNVLVFEAARSKLGDLGHAHDRSTPRPGDERRIAGDPTYAPPEQFYSHSYTDWDQRRMASDLYLLGSLVVFFFSGFSMTAHISAHISPAHHWSNNSGLDYSTALPYVRDAFEKSFGTISPALDAGVRDDLVGAIHQLCEPDPDLRGHPSNIRGKGARYSAERYISLFERLAKAAEYGLIGA